MTQNERGPTPPKLDKGLYRHNKTGNIYEVIGLALETQYERQWLVIYRPRYEYAIELFARPLDNFTELVEVNGKMVRRFEKYESPRSFLA